MNPYDILQVSSVADAQVIRAAYRSLIQRHHPDRHPGNAEIADLAAHITQAYELLADPERRAAYDAQHNANEALAHVARASKGEVRARSGAARKLAEPKSTQAAWALRIAVLLVGLGIVWMLVNYVSMHFSQAPPAEQLSNMRLKMEGAEVNEAERRQLFARKQELLAQHPHLMQADRSLRIGALAQRSVALLTEPLAVNLVSAPGFESASVKLIVPEMTLLLGSFDAPRLQAHLHKHRSRIVAELMQRLAAQSAVLVLGPDSEVKLKRVIQDSVMLSLELRAEETYPSTYFESPGRHGVVDVILPQSFGVLR